MSQEPKLVEIYTDGASEPNPGPGGYGVVLVHGEHRREFSGGFRYTTNNRMELYAAIAALEALKEPCRVKLHSDSEYLVRAMTEGWLDRWRAKGWRNRSGGRVVNIDLWERLIDLCNKHQVEFNWVKGHAGHRENERCDQLSMMALARNDLPSDEGYEHRQDDLTEDESPVSEGSGRTKITAEGQPCRECSTPVIKRLPRKKARRDRAYYFEYYLFCPRCHRMYMVEEAKRYFEDTPPELL